MKRLWIMPFMAMLTSCSTMNQSFQLGAGIGAASGIAAIYAGSAASGHNPNVSSVAISAGLGAGLGLLTSYLVHKSVEEDRASFQSDQTEMQFGDLPPSPFIVPKTKPTKKGAH